MGFGGSGGGSGSIAGSSDVALNNPQDSQVLTYSSSTAKWTNQVAAASSATPGEIALDSFAGATDDDKLVAAMAYASAQTYPPVIRMAARQYTLTQSLGQPYNGFALAGANVGWVNKTPRTTVSLNITPAGSDPAGYWLNCTAAQTWDLYVGGISFTSSNQKTQFIRCPGSAGVLWSSTFDTLTFASFYAVLGNSSEPLTTDLCSFVGPWSILQAYDTPVALKGADNREIFSGGLNIGSGTTPSGGGGGKYLVWLTSLSKSNVGPLYITADNGWRGLHVSGSSSSGCGVTVTGAVIEGRNPTDPCDGILVNVDGGGVTLRDSNVDCGMANPSAGESGLIQISGSDTQVVIDGLTVSHAANVAVTTPAVYVTGSPSVRVRNVMRMVRSGGPSWGTQLPVVHQTSSGLVADNDSSVQII